jgi:hypothetical protein
MRHTISLRYSSLGNIILILGIHRIGVKPSNKSLILAMIEIVIRLFNHVTSGKGICKTAYSTKINARICILNVIRC